MRSGGLWKRLAVRGIFLALPTALAPGCGDDTVEPQPTASIRTELVLRDSVVGLADTIVARVTARNEGTAPLTLKMACSFSFIGAQIEDLHGHCVSHCLRACVVLPDSETLKLTPGDSISATYDYWTFWDHTGESIPPGSYSVVGGLFGEEARYPWARVPLRIVATSYADRSNRPLQPTAPYGGLERD